MLSADRYDGDGFYRTAEDVPRMDPFTGVSAAFGTEDKKVSKEWREIAMSDIASAIKIRGQVSEF